MLAHRTRRAAALLALLALLAGCDSNPSPAPLPSESPSPSSSSPSPTATPPTLPAEAKGTSEASAKAFVRHWVDTLNYAGDTGDTTRLREISAAKCEACNGIIKTIDDVHAAGGHFNGDGWALIDTKYQPLQPATEPVLSTRIAISPQEVVQKAGAKPTNYEGGHRSRIFRLLHQGDGWTLSSLEAQQ